MHPAVHPKRACLVIDLKSGTFDHYTNVRIRSLDQWQQIFGEVADGFDAYFPPDRGITSTGRSNRIECNLLQTPDWRGNVGRFLKLCRDYWLDAGKV